MRAKFVRNESRKLADRGTELVPSTTSRIHIFFPWDSIILWNIHESLFQLLFDPRVKPLRRPLRPMMTVSFFSFPIFLSFFPPIDARCRTHDIANNADRYVLFAFGEPFVHAIDRHVVFAVPFRPVFFLFR